MKYRVFLTAICVLSVSLGASANEGAGSSGGGNMSRYVLLDTPERVLPLVIRVRRMLNFNMQLMGNSPGSSFGATELLFAPNPPLESLLKTVKYDIRMDRPCFEGQEPREGSADAKTNTICLSPFFIAQQKYPDTGETERKISGLLAHEVAHLRGADENQAREVGGAFEGNAAIVNEAMNWIANLRTVAQVAISHVDRTEDAVSGRGGEPCDAADKLHTWSRLLEKVYRTNVEGAFFSDYDWEIVARRSAVLWRMDYLKANVCEEGKVLREYRAAFSSHPRLNVVDFIKRDLVAHWAQTSNLNSVDVDQEVLKFNPDQAYPNVPPSKVAQFMGRSEIYAIPDPSVAGKYREAVVKNLNATREDLALIVRKLEGLDAALR